MLGLRQFIRDLALLPRIWRAAVKNARYWAEYDRCLIAVETEHPTMPPHKQRDLAHRRHFSLLRANVTRNVRSA